MTSFISANILGPDGLIIVLVIAIVLFGSTQIPKIARSLGSAQKEFKTGLEEGATEETPAAPASLPGPAPHSAVPAPAPAPPQAPGAPDNAS